MALVYKAAVAFSYFGHAYAAGDTIDTTSWGPEDVERLVRHEPVYVASDTTPVHSHVESDVASLIADLAAKAAAVHTHTEANVTGLTSDLAGKAAAAHSHVEGDVASLATDLAAKALLQETVHTVAASGAAQTLPDVTSSTMHKVTLTANCTITVPAPGAGKSFSVELVQDGTGGRSVTWATPSGAIRWPHGSPPVITGTAAAVDVITFLCVGGINWYAFVAGQAMA